MVHYHVFGFKRINAGITLLAEGFTPCTIRTVKERGMIMEGYRDMGITLLFVRELAF